MGKNMDNKAMYRLSYGVFMLSTKAGEKVNGCITNTCMQVANSPTRVAISVLNSNYTCDLIKESGIFTLSMLDQTVTFETISHFGFQSGRNVDKFANMTPPIDSRGIPYMGWQACAVLHCKVVSSQDLGSHTLFIAEVEDAQVLSDKEPLTYADYQSKVKAIKKLLAGAAKSAIMYIMEASFRQNLPARPVDTAQTILNQFMHNLK